MRQRRAFTLVELRVVIAIIGVLVAILMPALGKARQQARLLDCLTRIRQCAIASAGLYAADYAGAIPPVVTTRAGMPAPVPFIVMEPGGGWGTPIYDSALPYRACWPDLLQLYLDPKNQRDQPTFNEYSPVLYCAS